MREYKFCSKSLLIKINVKLAISYDIIELTKKGFFSHLIFLQKKKEKKTRLV